MNKILAIIQARMGSTRLQGKVLMEIQGKSLIEHIYNRLSSCPQISQTVVATSHQEQDLPIVHRCRSRNIEVFQGSEHDVLDRFHYVASKLRPDHIIRVTADCPLIDPTLVQELITKYFEENLDYCAISTGAGSHLDGGKGTFPDGLDCEIFRYAALEEAWIKGQTAMHREHVTPYIWLQGDRFKLGKLHCPDNLGAYRLTVDHPEDYLLVKNIYQNLGSSNDHLNYRTVVEYLQKNKDVTNLNQRHVGNEGYEQLYEQKGTHPL